MEINSKGKEVSLSEVESVHRKKCDKILEKSDEGGALFEGGMKKRLRGHTSMENASGWLIKCGMILRIWRRILAMIRQHM